MPPRPSTSLFEDAIDVPAWLENDRLTPYATRTRRDRDIGSQVSSTDSVQQVRLWWRDVRADTSDSQERRAEDASGSRLQRIRQLVTAAMIAIGASFGCGVALAAFHLSLIHI